MIPCEAFGCPNYGRQCYDHCNHCFQPVLWRPPLLDKEIAYKGPKPLNPPDGRTVHRCMRGGTKDGRFYHTDPTSRQADQSEQKQPTPPPPPWPLPLPEGVHLGTTHLWVNNEFVPLYKCPLCHFQNIHKDVINHHIKYSSDKYHNASGIII
jgi:hypothetical protein